MNNVNIEEIYDLELMIKGAYRKLKSTIFYDKNNMYLKKRIADFEYEEDSFNSCIIELVRNLEEYDNDPNSESSNYFSRMLEDINVKILPKSFASKDSNIDTIAGWSNNRKQIMNVNYFVDLPVELQLIDMLWTIFVSKELYSQDIIKEHNYSLKFKPSVFTDYSNKENANYIDFVSNRFYKPYFESYTKWRDEAFSEVTRECINADMALLNLDLKRYFYSVNIDFSTLLKDVEISEGLFIQNSLFQKLNIILESVYSCYYRKYCKFSGEIVRDKPCLILGLNSSKIISEMLLLKLDQEISDIEEVVHYGRYVDDIILVIKKEGIYKNSTNDIKNFITENTDALISENEDITTIRGFDNLKLNNSKITSLVFKSGEEPIMLNLYKKVISNNSSVYNLLPSIDDINSDFHLDSFNTDSTMSNMKIKDLSFVSCNKLKIKLFFSRIIKMVKNAELTEKDVKNILKNILKIYKGTNAVEFYDTWYGMFELVYAIKGVSGVQNNKQIDILKEQLLKAIEDISYENISDYIKCSLYEFFHISRALALAPFENEELEIVQKQYMDEFGELNKKIRVTNMLNYHLLSDDYLKYFKNDSGFDEFRLSFSPRFIHLFEFNLTNQLSKMGYTIDNIYEYYKKYNGLALTVKYIRPNKVKFNNDIIVEYYDTNSDITSAETRVALFNSKIKPENALTPDKSLKRKDSIFKLLNLAVKNNVNYVVFPEFFMPYQWVLEISLFAYKNNISIITGMCYQDYREKRINFKQNKVYMFIPYTVNGFTNSLAIFREKNYYAPEEKVQLARNKYRVRDKEVATYHVVNNNNVRISNMLCFEFTDIMARASLKSKLDILFVPQFNKDTNYFSNIVESASRDLHCFIVQSNTSLYGDSRITAPYKTYYKNIVRIDGGENDLIIVGVLNLDELNMFRRQYSKALSEIENICYRCRKKAENKCEKCNKIDTQKKVVKHKKIKSVPINYKWSL